MRGRSVSHLAVAIVVAAAIGAMPWLEAPRELSIAVDGKIVSFTTRYRTVEAALRDGGVKIYPEDLVFPARSSGIVSGQQIAIHRAPQFVVVADGVERLVRSQATTVGELLLQSGVPQFRGDVAWMNGRPVEAGTTLAPAGTEPLRPELVAQSPSQRPGDSMAGLGRARFGAIDAPVRLVVHRAMPIRVIIDGLTVETRTNSSIVSSVLDEIGIPLRAEDLVAPGPFARLVYGQTIVVRRAKPIVVTANRRVRQIFTHAKTVIEALEFAGVPLTEADRIEPDPQTPVTTGLAITVTRLAQRTVIENTTVARETEIRPDPDLPIDQLRFTPGSDGVEHREITIYYEDGVEQRRNLVRTWMDPPVRNAEERYGTKIALGSVETEAGSEVYWRKMNVFTTGYNASHGGKELDDPYYGITFTGMRAGRGVVATDPSVIPLYTRLYIPGYGVAIAGDIGGGVKGRWVDLGFEEGESIYEAWSSGWIEVYLLGEAPPVDEIRFILPDYPSY